MASTSSALRMPLPACEALPGRDASLGSKSMSPARVAWHGMVQLAQRGLAQLLTAYFGTALLLIPFRMRSLHLEAPAQPYFGAHWHIRHLTPVLYQLQSPSSPLCSPIPLPAPTQTPWGCSLAQSRPRWLGLLVPSALGAGSQRTRHIWQRGAGSHGVLGAQCSQPPAFCQHLGYK